MSLAEQMDKLSEEAIFLEPGNVLSCGKMLTLLDEIEHPSVEKEKKRLKGYLETMILQDLDGGSVKIEDIVQSVEDIRNIIMKIDVGENIDIPGDTGSGSDGVTDDVEPDKADVETDITGPSEDDFETAGEGMELIEDIDLIMDFIGEAKEHLDSIELNMVEWERSPNDKEIINSVFRPFHTIKGVAGFLNLKKINHLSHQLENLLDETREGNLNLTPELSDLIFDGVDVLKSMIISLETAVVSSQPVSYDADIGGIVKRISAMLNLSGKDREDSDESLAIKTQPLGEILVKNGKIREDDLKEVLDKQKENDIPKPVGEMLINEKKVTVRDVRDAIRKQSESAKVKVEKHIKVDTHKMDQLLNMVGELVIAQSMVTHNPDVVTITKQRFIRDISQLTRVTATLQSISMSMRLVPIGVTFQKMNRIVRDLSRKSGKRINLIIQGESAEIDRNMVEELYDPLVHMIRNSCDHGIKTPDKRKAVGKPSEGTIVLKAEHAGGKIVITISDDGEGLDHETIMSKAREKGLWTEDERPDDRTIDNFIFAAGFSTAKQVTDVSGRGVGMDVVRKALEKLHGTVEITSGKGVGTTFTVKLPLTTAIIDGMLVKVGEERYIIPTLSVRQLVHPKREDITTVVGRGETVNVRDHLLPLVRLKDILGIDTNHGNSWDGVLVVVEDSGREFALQVDSVIGKQEVVIKSLDERLTSTNGVAGGAILGDGRVGLILDIRSIASEN